MDILNLPYLKVISEDEHPDHYVFTAETIPWRMVFCETCLSQDTVIKHGVREQSYLDLSIHGKKVEILIGRQRYRCKKCNGTFLEATPDIDDKRAMTNRLIKYIQEQSLRRTFTSMAEEIGVDEKTVRNVFSGHVADLEQRFKFETPRILGIDEVHLLKSIRCVLTNIEEATIFDMLETRSKNVVYQYLMNMPDRKTVELVAMDMWRPYRDAVRAAIPDARIIIDKFHIVKMANYALEAVRKRTRENQTRHGRRALMKDRFTLLRRKKNLDEKELLKLDIWTKNFPELGQAYTLKESFFDIWNCQTAIEAKEAYKVWKASIPLEIESIFEPLVISMTHWETEIFAFFDFPITNALTEAKNGVIKNINRNGRGYSFDVLRAKILFNSKQFKTRIEIAPSVLRGVMTFATQKNFGIDITTFTQDFHIEDFQASTTG